MMYTLELTPEEMDKIGVALGRLPYADVAELISKVQIQINEQEKEPVKKPGK